MDKNLELPKLIPSIVFHSNFTLLMRVLGNMVINALEASTSGESIRMWCDIEKKTIVFCVWNRVPIPEHIAPRVFQKNFSTRKGIGRGLGTYSMKVIGEKYLGGKVWFTTYEKGTTFRLALMR